MQSEKKAKKTSDKSDGDRQSSKDKDKKSKKALSPAKASQSEHEDKSEKSKKKKDKVADDGKDSKKNDGGDKQNAKQDDAIQAAIQPQQQVQQEPAQKLCVHHELPLIYFCETCEEPICRQCTILGPHNNQLHRIVRIEDAYKIRVSKLSDSIKSNLLIKRDQLMAQIHRIEYRIEEIRYVKQVIERDVRAEYGGILERLKSAEGIKVAVLQHEMSELQKDLDRINDIGHTFNEFTQDLKDPVGFLLRARNLYENIEYQVAKPFKINIDVYPYDLPRELTEMRIQLQKVQAQKALIEFKNEVIWKLLEEKKKNEQQLQAEMSRVAEEDQQEWYALTNSYSKELKKYYMVCHYCNTWLDETSINKKCPANNKNLDPSFEGYTQKEPEQKYFGNGFHFFGKPKKNYSEYFHDPNSKMRNTATNNKQQFMVQIEIIIERIKKYAEKDLEAFKNLFLRHDKQNKGFINKIQFMYIMTEEFELNSTETDSFYKYLNPGQGDQVSYHTLISIIEGQELADSIPVRQNEAEL